MSQSSTKTHRKRLRKTSQEDEEKEEEDEKQRQQSNLEKILPKKQRHQSNLETIVPKKQTASMFFADEAEKEGSDHSDDELEEEELSQETKKFIAEEEDDDDEDVAHHSALAMELDNEETEMWTALARKYQSEKDEEVPVHESCDEADVDEEENRNDPDELFIALSSREKARVVISAANNNSNSNNSNSNNNSNNNNNNNSKSEKKKLVFVDLTSPAKNKQKQDDKSTPKKELNKKTNTNPKEKKQGPLSKSEVKKNHVSNKNAPAAASQLSQKSSSEEKTVRQKVEHVEENKEQKHPQKQSAEVSEYFEHRKPTRDNIAIAVDILDTIPWIGSPRLPMRTLENDPTRLFWNNPTLISTMFLQQEYPALMLDYNPYTRDLSLCTSEEKKSVDLLAPFVNGEKKTMCVSFVVRQKGQVVISWWFPKNRRLEHWNPRATNKSKSQPCAVLFASVEAFVSKQFGVRVLKSTNVTAEISPWKQARSTNMLVLSNVVDELDGLWCLAATYCRFNHRKMREIWHMMRKGPFTPSLAHHFIIATMMHFCDTSSKGIYAAYPERVTLMEKNLSFQPRAVTLFAFSQKNTKEIILWPPSAQSRKKTSVVVVSAQK